MADAAGLGWKDDTAFVDFLARKVGVTAVPGSSFYARGGGKTQGAVQLREEGVDAPGGGAAARRGGPAPTPGLIRVPQGQVENVLVSWTGANGVPCGLT